MRNNIGHCELGRGAGILPASHESFIKPRAGCPRYARAGSPRHVFNHGGFTLVELMVVITIIAIVLATALPTVSGLFNAGADEQAYNLLAAQVASARALAITRGAYAGVHVQMADQPDLENKCYSAIVVYNPDPAVRTFSLAPGHLPQVMPGNIAFGQLTAYFVDVSDYQHLDNDTDLADFTAFTILFNPQGQVVTNVEGNYIEFAVSATGLFAANGTESDDLEDTQLWAAPASETGVSAVTMFDYKILRGINDGDDRAEYLNQAGQFLCLNLYTGQFFYRY